MFNLLHFKKNVDVKNLEELFRFTSNLLLREEVVEKSFFAAITKREEQFPTGLNLGSINVAIPHTDPVHVKKSGIVFIQTKQPIKMLHMATDSNFLQVKHFFFLLVSEGKLQIDFLTNLMKILRDKNFVKKIESTSKKEFSDFLRTEKTKRRKEI